MWCANILCVAGDYHGKGLIVSCRHPEVLVGLTCLDEKVTEGTAVEGKLEHQEDQWAKLLGWVGGEECIAIPCVWCIPKKTCRESE